MKQKKLNKLEKIKREKRRLAILNEDKSTQASFTSQFAAKMVENIQVFIENIHIRYEDDRNPDHPFSCGISIQSATATSADELYRPIEKLEQGGKLVYKVY